MIKECGRRGITLPARRGTCPFPVATVDHGVHPRAIHPFAIASLAVTRAA